MANKVWKARECEIKLVADPTITTAAVLDSFFSAGTAISGIMKDVTIKEPSSEVDQIDLLGQDSNSFQNAEGEEKPYGMAEISGTAILPGDEVTEIMFYPTGVAIAATHTRYRMATGTRKRPAILLNLDDGTDEVSFVLDNTWITTKEVKATGADGHMEITFTAKCLPRDFYGPEFKD